MLPTSVPRIDHPPVVLRPFAEHDAALVASVVDDPVIPLITTVPTTADPAAIAAYLRRQHDRLAQGVGYSFAVADAVTGEGVGQIGLWTADLPAGRTTTGYWIAPQHRRRGYARAALAAVTSWALAHDEVARVQLHVEPVNEASWRTAEACGYEREGLLRSWERVGAERRDMYVYAAVRPDRTLR
ncbi:GNAT family N-acetyltransferase [Pimelobacter sp. 30-1]|uniref:GNAT family N-acetyltransferase n=1 Tax=Pimelobacter sp. 30-1 TaxID=2004991 RepID=UPI001C044457|nr:GNAT family protein [Pimelobacter sp. 30-1]MBU2697326.1 hypothetical protein [Pimelobacter sp. 30-1]